MNILRPIDEATEEFQRGILSKLLVECTKPQLEVFTQLYPVGVPAAKLTSAIDLCQRTVRKNREAKKTE